MYRYRVTLCRDRYDYAKVVVIAETPEDANRLAVERAQEDAGETIDWDPGDPSDECTAVQCDPLED